MIADIRDILTLDDDKEYVVASKTEYEGQIYYYLVDIDDITNMIFCYEDDNELVEFRDKEIFANILPKFLEASRSYINNN